VSRRSLECVFQSIIGIGPVNYIRILQLNLIRRDLLSDASAAASIGVIAARHGVWHWSRFSQYYGMLFGELPSETRRRTAKSAETKSAENRQFGRGRITPSSAAAVTARRPPSRYPRR
jgi:transcriptional regulator GlxA family with amidase domain